MENPFDLAQQAAESVLSLMNARPQVAVVLGSGWAAAADGLGSISAQTPLSSLPGVPEPTVQGHSGLLTLVDVSGIPTLLIGGRNHLYEGHPVATVVHTVRAAVLAGCSTVVLTNAAGSLVPENGPGTPVLLSDQLNLTGHNPMAGQGPPEGFPGRFCDVTNLYSPRLRAAIHDADPTIPEGVYAGMLGGAYETPAEIRMLRTLGADLVGMSTVLESIAAHHLGAEVIGVSLVTNMAAGMGGELSHGEVLEVAQTSTERIVDLIGTIIRSA